MAISSKASSGQFKVAIARLAILVIPLCVIALCVNGNSVVLFIFRLERQWYSLIEVPRVVYEAEKISGVTFVKVVDSGPSDEVNFYVTFEVKNKGEITFYSPTIGSFTGQQTVRIAGIGDCKLPLVSPLPSYLQYTSIGEVIDDYDNLYKQVKQESELASPFSPYCGT